MLDRKLADVKDLAVVGFVEVIKHLPRLNRLFKAILAAAAEEQVAGALLIDYPGFNLRLAKALRKQLPAVTLSIPLAAVLTRVLRAALLQERAKEYLQTARMKGLDEGRIFRVHSR